MTPQVVLGIVGIVISIGIQFGGIVWWAATSHADRKSQRECNERTAAAIERLDGCVDRLEQLGAQHSTRIALVEASGRPARQKVRG